MKIQFSDLFTEVKRISAYEAKGAVDGNGQSVFTETVVTDHEKPIIYAYFAPIAGEIRQTLNSAIKDVDIEPGESMDFIFHGDFTPLGNSDSFRRRVFDLIANYAMRNWLTEKKAGRAEFYTNIVADMLAQLPRFAAGLIYEGILPDEREGGTVGNIASRQYNCTMRVIINRGAQNEYAALIDPDSIIVHHNGVVRARNASDAGAVKFYDINMEEVAEEAFFNDQTIDQEVYAGVNEEYPHLAEVRNGRLDIIN